MTSQARARRRTAVLCSVALALVASTTIGPNSASALPGLTERVSVSSTGEGASNSTGDPAISANGNVVAYEGSAGASNLVPGDTNGQPDIFVHDRATNTTTRVSVDSAGAEGNDDSLDPDISADGNVVVFRSSATNLVLGDSNGLFDIFVHDRTTGITTRVSVDSAGTEANGASTGIPAISADGNVVAFASTATNLVAGDTNGVADIFIHDRTTGITTRVSVDTAGTQGDLASSTPALDADGSIVAFLSEATNLVPGDTNGVQDVFVHDRSTGATTRASVNSAGIQANDFSRFPSLSADGNLVAFDSGGNNLVEGDTNETFDVFVHDRTSGITTRVSVDSAGVQGNAISDNPDLSADGTRVVFSSVADNLVPGDINAVIDVFVHDRTTGITTLESVDSSGNQTIVGASSLSVISGDGSVVSFRSFASNLVVGDTNNATDVFVHELQAGPPPPPTSTTIEPPTTTTSTTMAPTTTTSTTMAPTTTTSTTMAPTTTTSTTMAPTTTTSTTMAPTTTTSTTMAPTTTTSTTMAPTTTTSTTMAPTTTTSTTMAPTTTTMAPPDGPLEIDDSALGSGNVVRITGTITCDEGQRFRLEVLIAQGDTNGRGVATGTCTGDPQNFRVNVTATSGPGFEDGSADVDATAQVGTPGSRTIVDTFSTSEDVTIDVRGGFMGQMLRAFQAMENLGA